MFVHIRDLHFQYQNTDERTIDQFNLTINQGEITTILGESGSGKSTLLRLIAGLEMPTKGNIMVGDDCMCSQSKLFSLKNVELAWYFKIMLYSHT